jgi:purine-nucleoside/S-methyl-5'-thioadenosine phosphorylase / adenosine deaminase
MTAPPLFITPDWPAPPGVRALCTVRRGGVSTGPLQSLNFGTAVGDSPEALAENRRRLTLAAGLPAEPRWLRQVHGTTVADLDQAALPDAADAAVTRAAGVVCAVLTADCLPLLLACSDGSAVAAVHAGWRGLAAGVIEATLARLATPANAIVAWLGPAIGPAHFEVGEDVRATFVAADGGAESCFIANARGRWQCDLYGLARQRLAKQGISAIFGGEHCTFAETERFFSHRRDNGATGRMATLIWRDVII